LSQASRRGRSALPWPDCPFCGEREGASRDQQRRVEDEQYLRDGGQRSRYQCDQDSLQGYAGDTGGKDERAVSLAHLVVDQRHRQAEEHHRRQIPVQRGACSRHVDPAELKAQHINGEHDRRRGSQGQAARYRQALH
jgi:hypothetical protein